MLMASARMIVLKKNDDDALDHADAAHPRRGDVDVRGREGAADGEGLIDEFAPSRLGARREIRGRRELAAARWK